MQQKAVDKAYKDAKQAALQAQKEAKQVWGPEALKSWVRHPSQHGDLYQLHLVPVTPGAGTCGSRDKA